MQYGKRGSYEKETKRAPQKILIFDGATLMRILALFTTIKADSSESFYVR